MSIKDLQKDIRKEEGYILSDGTLNLTHLLPKAYDLMLSYNLQTNLKKEIESVFTALPTFHNQYYGETEIIEDKMEDAVYLWNEDIFNYFNNISPNGYYFGSSEGDGACLGWFKYEENEDF